MFEATNGGELLERFNGDPVLESITAEERNVCDVYLRVLHKFGLKIRGEPDLTSNDIGELLLPDKVFTGSEVFKPAGSDSTFVRLTDGRGW